MKRVSTYEHRDEGVLFKSTLNSAVNEGQYIFEAYTTVKIFLKTQFISQSTCIYLCQHYNNSLIKNMSSTIAIYLTHSSMKWLYPKIPFNVFSNRNEIVHCNIYQNECQMPFEFNYFLSASICWANWLDDFFSFLSIKQKSKCAYLSQHVHALSLMLRWKLKLIITYFNFKLFCLVFLLLYENDWLLAGLCRVGNPMSFWLHRRSIQWNFINKFQ